MTTDKKLKFAVIGLGRVSKNHLNALTSGTIPGELAAVADINPAMAREKGEKYQVPYYTDYHQMLKEHPEIEVVNIATPTGLHARHVIDVARFGRHIVVEKPMALRVKDCDAMMKACEKNGCRLFVVKQNRFNKAVMVARQALEAGRFGKMVMGTVRVRWRRTQDYYEQDNWHGTWELDGGVMSQQASHHLDLLQWFMGPIDAMQCQATARLMTTEVEDTSVAIMKFASGALGAYEATVASRPEDMEASLSLMGEKGTVIIAGFAVNQIKYWKFTEPQPDDERIQQEFSQDIPNVYGLGHLPYLGNVIDAIVNHKPGLVEGPEGRKNIQILTALYESSACGGKTVKPGCPTRHILLGRPLVSPKCRNYPGNTY